MSTLGIIFQQKKVVVSFHELNTFTVLSRVGSAADFGCAYLKTGQSFREFGEDTLEYKKDVVFTVLNGMPCLGPYPSLKLKANAPENWCMEDLVCFLGSPKLAISSRECTFREAPQVDGGFSR